MPEDGATSRSVFVLRRGLFGYRRSDVLAALEEQRRQLDTLARSVDRLWGEKERAWHANHAASREVFLERNRSAEGRAEAARLVAEAQERAARLSGATAAGFQELAAKLDELLEFRDELVGRLSPPPDEGDVEGALRRLLSQARAR
jgi:hypothetical protein